MRDDAASAPRAQTDPPSRPRSPDVMYCPCCKVALERPANRMTIQCPQCSAMVLVVTPTFQRRSS